MTEPARPLWSALNPRGSVLGVVQRLHASPDPWARALGDMLLAAWARSASRHDPPAPLSLRGLAEPLRVAPDTWLHLLAALLTGDRQLPLF